MLSRQLHKMLTFYYCYRSCARAVVAGFLLRIPSAQAIKAKKKIILHFIPFMALSMNFILVLSCYILIRISFPQCANNLCSDLYSVSETRRKKTHTQSRRVTFFLCDEEIDPEKRQPIIYLNQRRQSIEKQCIFFFGTISQQYQYKGVQSTITNYTKKNVSVSFFSASI